jgi:hypothetical protein
MRRLLLAVALPALLAAGAESGTAARKPAFSAVLTADTHTPKVDTEWHYHVRVTDPGGHPIWARITSQIADPLGGMHPVEFDGTGHNPYVRNYRFFGNFCDSAVWPRSSAVGVTLRFQAVVVTARGRTVLTYRITPRP